MFNTTSLICILLNYLIIAKSFIHIVTLNLVFKWLKF